jgi:ABC-type uncharacterized transport system ATPase subunit
MSLTENALLTGAVREGAGPVGLSGWGAARGFAERDHRAVRRAHAGPRQRRAALSGGNLQKFVIGREILQRPDVLVVNQPTWGVDAAAAAAIRQALLDLAAGRRGGDRDQPGSRRADGDLRPVRALNEGRLSAPRPRRGLTMDEIGLMMGGAHDMDAHVCGVRPQAEPRGMIARLEGCGRDPPRPSFEKRLWSAATPVWR